MRLVGLYLKAIQLLVYIWVWVKRYKWHKKRWAAIARECESANRICDEYWQTEFVLASTRVFHKYVDDIGYFPPSTFFPLAFESLSTASVYSLQRCLLGLLAALTLTNPRTIYSSQNKNQEHVFSYRVMLINRGKGLFHNSQNTRAQKEFLWREYFSPLRLLNIGQHTVLVLCQVFSVTAPHRLPHKNEWHLIIFLPLVDDAIMSRRWVSNDSTHILTDLCPKHEFHICQCYGRQLKSLRTRLPATPSQTIRAPIIFR